MRLLYPEHGLEKHCRLFGKSRQAYYNWKGTNNTRTLFEAVVVEMVRDIRIELKNQRIGGRKLLLLLNEKLSKDNLKIGRDSLYSIMSENNLLVRKRRRRVQTTYSDHNLRRYPNLIKGKTITKPENLWVSDITYIKVGEGYNYLSLLSDAFSRKIVGYYLNENLSSKGPEEALLMALAQREDLKSNLIHHSDQGVQYCSYNYVSLLRSSDIKISMSKKASPQENAIAERINGILKNEYQLEKGFTNTAKAKTRIREAIYSYNYKRPHMSLGMKTPQQMHNVNLLKDLEEQLPNKDRIKKTSVKVY